MLFNWTLILYGTETDPLKGNLRINASLPTTQPMSRTPTTVTEATERRSKSLSGRCLLTGFGMVFARDSVIKREEPPFRLYKEMV